MFTAYLKAKKGTAFKLYKEWRNLSEEEKGLWSMDGRMLTADMDKERLLYRVIAIEYCARFI